MSKKTVTFVCILILTEILKFMLMRDERDKSFIISRPCYFNENSDLEICTVLPAKSDSDVMFCLHSYQGLIIDISLVY